MEILADNQTVSGVAVRLVNTLDCALLDAQLPAGVTRDNLQLVVNSTTVDFSVINTTGYVNPANTNKAAIIYRNNFTMTDPYNINTTMMLYTATHFSKNTFADYYVNAMH